MFQKSAFQKHIDEKVEDNRRLVEADPHRLDYHLMPPAGLLNDPNGLIYHQGVYHVFFQWNPFETAHGKKAWGHYVSADLINWTLEPAALIPDAWYDKNGCYSGSAVMHDGRMHLFYTGNVKDEGDRRSTYQCLAVSEDGVDFEKKGPVLHLPDGYTPHFRDPKVWKEGDRWLMILGAQNMHGKGEAVLASSNDLTDWEFIGPIAGSGMNGLPDFGYMWECPDLFTLDSKDILIVCPQGLEAEGDDYPNLFQAGYFVGDFDSVTNTYMHGDFVELDRGFDFYAPQTFTDDDGRRILIGWMGMTDDQEQDQPTIRNNWIHALTIPRTLEMRDGVLVQQPVAELRQLRGKRKHYSQLALEKDVVFREVAAPSSEILLEFNRPVDGRFEMEIRNDLKISYMDGRFTVQRKTFDGASSEQRTFALDTLSGLQIFLDRSSVEIFINGGEAVATSRYFPAENDDAVEIRGHMHFDLSLWELEGSAIDMF
ncbi:sucrose-6-phosphate hydrolase [Salinicoccus cyprini]|uniref:Sucrose-6-phosphate hydrolase n=1 Tax=Salinicoccus cyprini TaxID=2493691 RepID=A0A558ATX8_9STAP|nr:sucrose-6-phosphate hydrolase [Salinicoccus cyprini]TVT27724.1 sucrose-6-phosphate hydrolase [Salinicoccus cyprini]